MIDGHKRALCYAAETGCRTYTIHIGAGQYNRFRTPVQTLREAALRTLDELVPHAEKLGVVIAVENSFEPPNTPDEVLFLLEHFNSPALGCCYDAGHANVMAPAPGKRQDLYCPIMKEGTLNFNCTWFLSMRSSFTIERSILVLTSLPFSIL